MTIGSPTATSIELPVRGGEWQRASGETVAGPESLSSATPCAKLHGLGIRRTFVEGTTPILLTPDSRAVTSFDTAPRCGAGVSERRLGAALVGMPQSAYTVATKVGWRIVDERGKEVLPTPVRTTCFRI